MNNNITENITLLDKLIRKDFRTIYPIENLKFELFYNNSYPTDFSYIEYSVIIKGFQCPDINFFQNYIKFRTNLFLLPSTEYEFNSNSNFYLRMTGKEKSVITLPVKAITIYSDNHKIKKTIGYKKIKNILFNSDNKEIAIFIDSNFKTKKEQKKENK